MHQLELPLKWPEINLDGVLDEVNNIRFIGHATLQPSGFWCVLANVAGALCLVEVRISVRPA